MATLADALALARTWMGERQSPPEVFTDDFLIPIAQEVYRDIQRLLEKAGFPLLSDYAQFDVATGTGLVEDGDTGYPTDVLKPIRLWERAQGSALFADFVPMEEADPDLIPRAATNELTNWEWQGEKILFIAALTDRTVRMKYDKYLADLVDENSTLEIKDSVGAMSLGIAAGAGMSRGSPFAKDAELLYQGTVEEMINREQGRLATPA